MPFYEHVFLARQDLAQGQVDTLSEAVTKIVEDGNGKVTKTEYWGLRNIAYRIRKNRKAHYVLMNIDAPTAVVAEIERQAGLSEDVLRYQTVRVDELEAEPSAVLRKSDREDRGSRGGDRGGRGGGFRAERGPREDRGGYGDRAPRNEEMA
jgi:small subunit ribosomal protein S6